MTFPTGGEDRLAGRFEKVRQVGQGGMADLWLAKDHGPEPFTASRRVALKILRRNFAEDPTSLTRFELEGRAMSRFEHPNIAEVFQAMQDGEDHFLVMEYIEGCSVAQLLKERDAPIPPEDAVEIVFQVCAGIEYAHCEKIIHRDVKPANVMLDGGYPVDAPQRVKVTDFGIARAREGTRITQTGGVVGTPAYMAAEVAKGGSATVESDVYGCGVLLYQLLTGTLPFAGEDVSEIVSRQEAGPPAAPAALNPMVPRALSDATLVALEYRPAARYESAEDMGLAIDAAWEEGDFGEYLPTRHQAQSAHSTGPTLYRPHTVPGTPRSGYEPREPWLPLLKFFATVGALLVLLAVVLRLTSAIVALPIWILATAVGACVVAVALVRTPLFAADGGERTAARARLRRASRSTVRGLVIGGLAAYWAVLGYHLTTTVREAIERQPPASHLWLEIAGCAIWIAIALFPLKWLLRSRMQAGRLIVAGAVVALAWTGSAEVLPEAPGKVGPLIWSGRTSFRHRVAVEGRRWMAMLQRSRTGRSHPRALMRHLTRSRNAQFRALRRAHTPHRRHLARVRARRWLNSMRRARQAWRQPSCRQAGHLSITQAGARAICS